MIKEGDVIEFSSNRLINELQTLKELSGVLKISFSSEGNGMISCRGVEENGRREYSCKYTDVIVNGNDQKSENFNSSKKYKAGTTIHQ